MTSRGKAVCYYSYPLAILIDDAQILVQLTILGDLDLLLHHLVERFRCVIKDLIFVSRGFVRERFPQLAIQPVLDNESDLASTSSRTVTLKVIHGIHHLTSR